jgi:glucose-6-phosphate isomerase
MGLKGAIKIIFRGIINQTENRAVLHTALRAKADAIVNVNGKMLFQKFMR